MSLRAHVEYKALRSYMYVNRQEVRRRKAIKLRQDFVTKPVDPILSLMQAVFDFRSDRRRSRRTVLFTTVGKPVKLHKWYSQCICF